MASNTVNHTPWWAWAAPLAASLLLAVKFAHLVPADAPAVLIAAAVLLLACVFAAVHHAEIVALRVGEPLGSIVLAVAVTVIEVALIVSLMLAAPSGRRLAGAGHRVRRGDDRAEWRGRALPAYAAARGTMCRASRSTARRRH